MEDYELIIIARTARDRAYAPYSQFAVGAALVASSGRVYAGCNVENISFGLTQCAERTALCAAVCAGETQFSKIFIVADTTEPISPCGACRQVLAEFNPDMEIVSVSIAQGTEFRAKLSELLPRAKTGILG